MLERMRPALWLLPLAALSACKADTLDLAGGGNTPVPPTKEDPPPELELQGTLSAWSSRRTR